MIDSSCLVKKDRWYRVEIVVDLLGDLVLTRTWGKQKSKGNGRSIKTIHSPDEVDKIREKALKRCKSLGYCS